MSWPAGRDVAKDGSVVLVSWQSGLIAAAGVLGQPDPAQAVIKRRWACAISPSAVRHVCLVES